MHSQSINRKLSEARQNQHRTSVHNPTTYERRDSSPRNSVYADEPSNVINMDIMTGHLILVCTTSIIIYLNLFFLQTTVIILVLHGRSSM